MWSHPEREWLRGDETGSPTTVLIADVDVAERGPREPLDRCIKRADQALYAGKQSGRDRVQPAEPPA